LANRFFSIIPGLSIVICAEAVDKLYKNRDLGGFFDFCLEINSVDRCSTVG
jgi:hypothetical protein